MTRSRSAAVAVALCLVAAACSSGDGDGREAQGPTTSVAAVTTTIAPPTTTAAPATTTTTAAPTTVRSAGPGTHEEQAAVDAIDRWLELEDQAFSAGTTDAVIAELDALMEDGSVAVQGSLDLGGPVERTSRARIDRIWHPADGVTGLDVCKTIETPQGEARTAHTITATDGAAPFLQNETVSILERDGITCPPDDIIDPVLATYERWMELNTASALDPSADATELYELSGPEMVEFLIAENTDLAAAGRYEVFRPTGRGEISWYRPSSSAETEAALVTLCHRVEDDRGVYDADTNELLEPRSPGELRQFNALLVHAEGQWLVDGTVSEEDQTWCEERQRFS